MKSLIGSLLLVMAVWVASGCKDEHAPSSAPVFYPVSDGGGGQRAAERDSVFQLLQSIDESVFRNAFSAVGRRSFTRYARTEQYDNNDFLVAYRENVVRHDGGSDEDAFRPVTTDTAGTFNFGYFDRFVGEHVSLENPPDFARFLLPEEPPYLSERNRQAYLYRFLPDTLMWDVAARVVEIRARPSEADGQNIRRVRLYVDPGTNQLLGLYLERIDLAMLFREESRFYADIRLSPSGVWAPYNTRFETRLRVPFRPPQRFRTVATYYDVDA